MSGPLCKHGWSIHFCGPCSADLFFKSQAKRPRDEDMLAMEPENVPEAAARIAQLEAEVERLTRDRISGSELKRWAAKHTAFADRIAQLEAALREIKELPGELNPSNYTHDDVCACNDAFVRTWQIASAALGEERT